MLIESSTRISATLWTNATFRSRTREFENSIEIDTNYSSSEFLLQFLSQTFVHVISFVIVIDY